MPRFAQAPASPARNAPEPPPGLPRKSAFPPVPSSAGLSRSAGVADLSSMCQAMRAAYQRLNRNGRGGRFLDYTLVAGNFAVTAIVLLASAGVRFPSH